MKFVDGVGPQEGYRKCSRAFLILIAPASVSAASRVLMEKRVCIPIMDDVLAAGPCVDCVGLVGANEG